MTYADINRLSIKLGSYKQIDDDLLNESITTSDNMINQYLQDEIPGFSTPSPLPSILEEAGVLLASMAAVDTLFANSERRPIAAETWEKQGEELLKRYVSTYENDTLQEGSNIFIDTLYNSDQMEEDEEETEE